MPTSRNDAAVKRSVLKAQEEILSGLASMGREKGGAAAARALDQRYADDCIIIGSFGEIITKEQYMEAIRSNSLTYQGVKTRNANVRVYGDTAVVTSIASGQSQLKGQSVGGGEFSCTCVFVRGETVSNPNPNAQGSEWRLVSAHVSFIDQRVAAFSGGATKGK